MALTLEIVSEHRELVGDDCVRVFRDAGGTIGRAFQSDWILPDPEKYISGRHATIDCKGGAWFLADTSTNGTYFNDEREPLGARKPRRLFDGDRLRMGEFEIVVRIDDGENLELPPDPKPTVVPDHIEQLVPEEAPRTGASLLDEDEITGDEAFRAALAGEGALSLEAYPEDDLPATEGDATPPSPGADPGEREVDAAAADEAPVSLDASPGGHTGPAASESGAAVSGARPEARYEAAFANFLDGLGLSPDDLPPEASVDQVLRNAGLALREFVAGAGELLALQEDCQQELRFEEATELPGNRNALKRSASTKAAIRQLLVDDDADFLGPQEAVRVACRDLHRHQEALLAAMLAGCRELVQRFAPDELAEEFNRTLSGKPLPGALRRVKFWRLYTELYPELAEADSSRFPRLFADEMSRVYEQAFADVNPSPELGDEPDATPGMLRESDFEQDVGSKLSFALASDQEHAEN